MSRPLRVEYPGALYLVTARARPRQRLFRDEVEQSDFVARLPELAASYGAVFHGFCVLPDHYHLMVETPRGNLSQVVHRLNAGYTATLNARRRRTGPLLQSRYRALLLGEEWLVPLSIHVHLNPVRKRLSPDPWTYRGSSAAGYARRGAAVTGLTTDRVLALAGGREAYATRVDAAVRQPPPAPWKHVWRHVALGGEELRTRVLDLIQHRDLREVPGFSPRPEGTRLEAVLGAVAESTGLDPSQVTSGKYQRVMARKAAIYLARRFTPSTLREIGELFGVDYTTVHMTVRRVEELRRQDEALDAFLASLEETLREQKEPFPDAGPPAAHEVQDTSSAPLPAEPPGISLPPDFQKHGKPAGHVPFPDPATEAEQGPAATPSRKRGRKKEGGQLDLF